MSEAKIEDPSECRDAAPFKWRIRCLSFEPSRFDAGLLGFATFALEGGLLLRDGRICRTEHGLGVHFRRLGVLSDGEADFTHRTVKPISFPRHADWMAFNAAALSALRAAFPDAIPDR